MEKLASQGVLTCSIHTQPARSLQATLEDKSLQTVEHAQKARVSSSSNCSTLAHLLVVVPNSLLKDRPVAVVGGAEKAAE